MTADATFAPIATSTTVDALAVGDFVERIPAQDGVRGLRVNSGIASLEPDLGTWRRGPRGRKEPVASVRIAFLNGVAVNVPATFVVVARPRIS